MKIDLLNIFDKNKELNEAESELEFKKELMELLASIIKNDSEFLTNNKQLINRIDLKYKDNEHGLYTIPFGNPRLHSKYVIKLSKANIMKVQKYIDNLEEEK